ncbi:MAG: ATP-binding protein [Sedimentibacter sp.]
MKIKYSLKNKLFLVILLVLIINIVLSIILGSSLFEKLYTNDKIKSLKIGSNQIRNTYLTADIDNTAAEIINNERQNMTICIFTMDLETGIGEIEYYSRQKFPSLNPIHNEITNLFDSLFKENAFSQLTNDNNFYLYTDKNNEFNNDITILSNITDNKYIIVQTPIPFIKGVANLAIKYSLYISMFTLFLGAILIYFIADRTTKPIRQIQIAADKISNLDFIHRCDVTSNDEIGLLAVSINNMAVKLQDYVSQLVVANDVLKNDLMRQEKTDKMRKQFVANVSHDFKTPLTLIMSYSEALLDIEHIDETTKKEYLNIIISEGNKMSEFVHELLRLSQLESGMIKLEKSNFSINEIINDTIRKNKIIAHEKNLHVEKSILDNSIVFGDYSRIEQVLQNLYENAVKYSMYNGFIRVSANNVDNKCIIKVYNEGNNISDEDLENIFTSFYRSDKSRKNMGSYGLGLAIVKAIMDMHNEKYGVSNVDGGVEFWFELENIDMDLEMEDD